MRILSLIFLVSAFNLRAEIQSIKALYESWHLELNKNSDLTEPMYFETNSPSGRLSEIVREIDARNLEMAQFLCEKCAAEGTISYKDAHLLVETAGMYWFIIEGSPGYKQVVEDNLAKNAKQFSLEWRAGKFSSKEVEGRVKSLCAVTDKTEPVAVIPPQAILPLRRLGVFAIPEMVRQVKLNNSQHAFATLLIMSRQRETYSEYINSCETMFPSKEDKMAEVSRIVNKYRQSSTRDNPLVAEMERAASN